ncbi:hypothetical protein BC829DRAFT_419587 [Chytridium lagenaria]|nr:hypothetical protein BC829DRAFT_419587 [Chytridium lagenaria]
MLSTLLPLLFLTTVSSHPQWQPTTIEPWLSPTQPPQLATPVPDSNGSLTPTRQLSVAFAIGALVLVGTGFTFCFLGRRSYSPTLFLGGFYTTAVAVFVTFELLQRRWRTFGPYSEWIYLVTIPTTSFIVGYLFLRLNQLGCVAIGLLLGLTWGIILLFTGVGGNLDENSHMVLLLVLSASGGAAVFFMEHLVIILGTANVGATAIVVGVDMLARTGFVEVFNRCLTGPTPPKSGQIPGPAWGALAAVIVIAVAGWFVQTRPGPPNQPSEWNPAYWLFGAQRPAPLPPTWFKDAAECVGGAGAGTIATAETLDGLFESVWVEVTHIDVLIPSLLSSIASAKSASSSKPGSKFSLDAPNLKAIARFRESLVNSRENLIKNEEIALKSELILLHRDIRSKDEVIQKYLHRSIEWYAALSDRHQRNQVVLDRTYRSPSLTPPSMETAITLHDLPIPSSEDDVVVEKPVSDVVETLMEPVEDTTKDLFATIMDLSDISSDDEPLVKGDVMEIVDPVVVVDDALPPLNLDVDMGERKEVVVVVEEVVKVEEEVVVVKETVKEPEPEPEPEPVELLGIGADFIF